MGLIIGAVSVIFALQNVFAVTVVFFSWELTTSLAVVILVSILMGFLASSLLSIPSAMKNIFVISRLRKENKNLGDDLKKCIANQEIVVVEPVEIVVTK